MNGLLSEDAIALLKLKPTDKQTIRPGPAVDATASISSIFIPRRNKSIIYTVLMRLPIFLIIRILRIHIPNILSLLYHV